ncbi:DUF1206 domain-containing protein [Streptomyces sp. NEAU-S7GS2]|uniref:DUF1206 domain-containing protein n=1 Tax=Streptomyces sp. NEAU-S7GS2 TaxID=2202000 RepID=UPI000D6F83A2|nr:DUF1206 domain-containing protein [Streptomyces sp. NEAU-S7GS2]AWN31620.1 hypothetical protein DKG71_41060 [Streptomyces sp. NEAU-S7GS2]
MHTTTAVPHIGRGTAHRAARSSAVRAAARGGFVARGVIYLLVGVLALRIAFGDPGEQADRGGALADLAARPFGSLLIWALGLGLAGMALWRLSEAGFGAAGPDGHKAGTRLLSLARFVFYAVVSFSVLSFAAGKQGSGSGASDQQSRDATAQALGLPGGPWLVAAAGAGIAVAGAWIAVRAVLRKFRKHLNGSGMSPRLRRGVEVLGISGGLARGGVFAVAGVFVVKAAVTYDPGRAKGMDDTLRSFADTPAGPWLLAAIAAGLALFGLFSFTMARWRNV